MIEAMWLSCVILVLFFSFSGANYFHSFFPTVLNEHLLLFAAFIALIRRCRHLRMSKIPDK